MFQSIKQAALLLLFCLTACVGEGSFLITKLGHNDNTNNVKEPATRLKPKPVFSAFSARSSHNLAINPDGELYAWGGNNYGELGDGTTTDQSSPVRIGTSTNWKSIATGGYHSLAINEDGELYAWGNRPVRIGTDDTSWVSVTTGSFHSLAINSDGELYAWGGNNAGQLGDGTRGRKNRPVRIGTSTNWVSVTAGKYHSLAINADGELYAWGNNNGRQLGLGDGVTLYSNTPLAVKIPAKERVVKK